MDVGKLRHRITIQRPVETQDSVGAVITTWADVATIWAAVEPLTMREVFNLQTTFAEATHKITMRYIPGVTAKCRVLFGSRIFNIEGPPTNPEERNERLVIVGKELQ